MNEMCKYLHDLDLRSIDCTASVHFSGISFESQQWFLNGHHAGSTKACFNEAYKRPITKKRMMMKEEISNQENLCTSKDYHIHPS